MIAALLLAMALPGMSPMPACVLPKGWPEIEARHAKFILFGETHGTTQSPAIVGEVACGLASKGERVLIAIEHDATTNAALQAAWAGPDRGFADTLLRTQGDWQGRLDGVASQAMLAMLVRLHALKTAGATIDVVAFNGPHDDAQAAKFRNLPGQGPHEAEQAENIRDAAEAKRYDHVLVLAGSLHARKQPVERGGVRFEPMAMQLAPAGEVTSLLMAYSVGTMWNCLLKPDHVVAPGKAIGPDDITCGDHPTHFSNTAAPRHLGLGAPPGELHPDPDPDYDGYYWLGPVTGSAPAAPQDEGKGKK